MKHLITCLSVAALISACGGSQGNAEKRYMGAIQKKLDGDQRGFYDDLMVLAVEESDTRAGRRARTAITGGMGLFYAAATPAKTPAAAAA
ncbi:MAG: hypothetical protein AAFU55_15270 [Pseudomonadota bacterium]